MNPRIQDHRTRVQSWLKSLDTNAEVLDNDEDFEGNPERPAKRARRNVSHSPGDDFARPFNIAPHTPPRTEHTEHAMDQAQLQSPSSGRGRKRGMSEIGGVVEVDDDGHEDTPRPKARNPFRPSPKKQMKKGRAILDQLRKPFIIHAIPNYAYAAANLAPDILPLYKEFLAANDRDRIIPYEVRDEVAAIEWHLPRYFREPNHEAEAQAKATFSALRVINRHAAESQTFRRHECSWNHLVHTPLLQLAFGFNIPERSVVRTVGVRCEPAMSATIVGDSIPFVRSSTGGTSEPACSVSLDSCLAPEDDNASAASNVSMSMLRSRAAKVDYVLVLDISEDDSLRKTISQLINHTNGHGLPHVNQTAYLPVKDSPIATSIEAKSEVGSEDPLIQLGIWTVAWYQRMYDLREALFGASPKPRLVSVPLIQVVAHNWHVYFACDAGTSVEVYGPVSLGSSENMSCMYVLLRSLEAIKHWMVDVFYHSLRSWFACEEDAPGHDSGQGLAT